MRASIEDAIEVSFNGKECKNSADHRKSLLAICNWFLNEQKHFIKDIFLTMSEIQEILYKSDNDRTPQKIIRLSNLLFIHAMLLKINVPNDLKSLTKRKMFGSYYHSLVRHSVEQYRLFSGRTTNTECAETTFNALKTSTNLASNHHPDNVITNAIMRVQARKRIDANSKEKSKQESYIHKLFHPIKMSFTNTVISFEWIETYCNQYQRLLEQIADYLVVKNAWWKEEIYGVEFLDNNSDAYPKKMHHFRSSCIQMETEFLKSCWKECLTNKNKLIPAYKIKILDCKTNESEDVILTTLHFFRSRKEEISEIGQVIKTDVLDGGLYPEKEICETGTEIIRTSTLEDGLANSHNFPIAEFDETDIEQSYQLNIPEESNIDFSLDIISSPQHNISDKKHSFTLINDKMTSACTSTPNSSKSKERESINLYRESQQHQISDSKNSFTSIQDNMTSIYTSTPNSSKSKERESINLYRESQQHQISDSKNSFTSIQDNITSIYTSTPNSSKSKGSGSVYTGHIILNRCKTIFTI